MKYFTVILAFLLLGSQMSCNILSKSHCSGKLSINNPAQSVSFPFTAKLSANDFLIGAGWPFGDNQHEIRLHRNHADNYAADSDFNYFESKTNALELPGIPSGHIKTESSPSLDINGAISIGISVDHPSATLTERLAQRPLPVSWIPLPSIFMPQSVVLSVMHEL